MYLYVGFVPGLGIQVLCDTTLYHWMSCSWRFGGSWLLQPQGSRCLLRNVGRLSAEYPDVTCQKSCILSDTALT